MAGRTYVTPFGEVPSVTTVLDVMGKPGLEQWYGKLGKEEADKIKQASADRGTRVHHHIFRALGLEVKELPELHEEDKGYLESFSKLKEAWPAMMSIKALFGERTVFSKHGFAGTLDFTGQGMMADYVLDWKTSKRIYDTAILQVCAYAYAAVEMKLIRPDVVVGVVRLKDSGKQPEILFVDGPKVWTLFSKGFMSALWLYNYRREWKKTWITPPELAGLTKGDDDDEPAAAKA